MNTIRCTTRLRLLRTCSAIDGVSPQFSGGTYSTKKLLSSRKNLRHLICSGINCKTFEYLRSHVSNFFLENCQNKILAQLRSDPTLVRSLNHYFPTRKNIINSLIATRPIYESEKSSVVCYATHISVVPPI